MNYINPGINRKLNLLLILIGNIAILFILAFILSILNQENALPIMLSFTYFSLLTFIVIDNYFKKKVIEITHPVIFYAFLWSIPFAIIPLIVVFSKDPYEYIPKSYMYVHFIPLSQLMAISSLFFMMIGFKSFSYIKTGLKQNFYKISQHPNWNKFTFLISFFVMTILTGLEITYLLERNAFILGVTDDLVEHQPSLLSYVLLIFGFDRISIYYLVGPLLILTIYYSKKQSSFTKKILFIVFIANILLGLISAQKERMAISILLLFIYYYYWNKNRKMTFQKELKFSFLILLLIASFPLVYLYRTAVSLGYEIKSFSDVAYLKDNFSSITETSPFTTIFNRFDHLNTNLSIVGQTPNFIDYKSGETYLKGLEAFLILIPKSTKSEDFGRFNHTFAREYNLVESFDYYSGITLPQFTEIYMNWGIAAIPLIMFLYGLFYALIYNIMQSENVNLMFLGFILYYIWVIQFSALAFSTTMIITVKTLIGFAIFIVLLNSDKILRKVLR